MSRKFRLFLMFLLAAPWLLAQVKLAENGQALAEIVVPAESPWLLHCAAKELQTHLRKLSGAEFPLVEKSSGKLAICLGEKAAIEAGLSIDGLPEDGFLISVAKNAIHIAGRDNPSRNPLSSFHLYYDEKERGTLLGVYQFLEKFGILWVGPHYTHIPQQTPLLLPEGQERISPSFANRLTAIGWNFMSKFPDAEEYCQSVNDIYRWALRLRFSNRSTVVGHGCHSENSLKLKTVWQDYPERFMMREDGTRNFNYLCWTDPAVTEFWIKAAEAYFSGLGPETVGLKGLNPYLKSKWPWPFFNENEFMIDPHDNDGTTDGRCRCPRCNAYREQHPCPDDSEIVWKVIVAVAEMAKEKFPGKYITTLIYPPKMQMPKTVKIPDNVRVRICTSGPKEIATPNRLESDLELIRTWKDLVGAENLPLWTYQCMIFARRLPGPPETYPHLTDEYLRKIKPLTAGMYLEMHALTFTYKWLDTYMSGRLMWDQSLSVDDELKAFFAAAYGPAAEPARELFARFEENWIKLWRQNYPDVRRDKPGCLGMSGGRGSFPEFQQNTWREVYHRQEMHAIDERIQKIESLCAGHPIYSKHARLLREQIFNVMQLERALVMDKEELRSKIRLELQNIPMPEGSFPSESAWANAAAQPLHVADRRKSRLRAGGSFKVLRSGEKLFVRADLEEPLLSGSKTKKGRQIGDKDIWRDNDVELFIYAPATNTFWQFVINDEGKWATNCLESQPSQWKAYPGVEISCQATPSGWQMLAAIPLTGLGKGEWRFNLTRSRMVEGAAQEYSTWSELAILGNWRDPDNYGNLIFKD
ncbi:MAG: hypothetical protein BWX73_03493 [Lentisphaerae bacterium ADurb.Bin082]|nr:MAG: hypothetical protein BWX73_03493 [Lentisphaerae bacterium ADurb.Bin082]